MPRYTKATLSQHAALKETTRNPRIGHDSSLYKYNPKARLSQHLITQSSEPVNKHTLRNSYRSRRLSRYTAIRILALLLICVKRLARDFPGISSKGLSQLTYVSPEMRTNAPLIIDRNPFLAPV